MIVVFNPTAGMPHASLLWCVLDVLVANGIRVELTETHWLGHAKALAREAVYALRTRSLDDSVKIVQRTL